jgi:ferredoxin-like protein FixX
VAALDDLIAELERSYTETRDRMSDPAVYNDHREAAEVGRRLKQLEGPYVLAQSWRQAQADLAAARGDSELSEMVGDYELEVARLEEELKLALAERDPADDKDVIIEVRQGVGGDEAAWRTLARGASAREALASYDESLRSSFIWSDLREVRNMRQAFGHGFYVGGALAGAMTASKGRFPPGDAPTERDADQSLISTDRATSYPAADGKLVFDKLSSVFASGNRTRDDQPNHIRIQENVPRELAELWAHMCPAQVYEVGEADGDGTVTVKLAPSNCVQCGAITAKGGRLTPPEGGSGPEYTVT